MDIKELRAEYKKKFNKNPFPAWSVEELKERIENFVEEPKKEEEPSEDSRITKLEKLVEQLSSENSNLREESAKLEEGWAEYKPVASENKTATVKIYREDSDSPAGVVVKIKTFKTNEWNEETQKHDKLVYTIGVRYDDGEIKESKVDAVEFAKIREVEKVEIVKENSKKLKKIEDYVPMAKRDKQGYPVRMLDGGTGFGQSVGSGQVPLEVFMVKSTVTVKRKNGQEFEMEADYLNL